MAPSRRPLKIARVIGTQAWIEDSDGNRTRVDQDVYDAWSAGRLAIAGAVQGAGGALRFDTPSGYIEDDTVVEVDGVTYACLRAQRSMAEGDDILTVAPDWRAGIHELRPGVRIMAGDIVHDNELPRPALPRGR